MVSLEGGCWKSALSSNSPAAYPTLRCVLRGERGSNAPHLPGGDSNAASLPDIIFVVFHLSSLVAERTRLEPLHLGSNLIRCAHGVAELQKINLERIAIACTGRLSESIPLAVLIRTAISVWVH
jgi:hypothetical protein